MIPVGEGPVARGTDATTPHLARVTRAGGGDVPGGQFLGEFPSVEIQARTALAPQILRDICQGEGSARIPAS